MAETLESILARLLIPDNAVLAQATLELREFFKDPNVVASMCQVLSNSENPQVRQYASVLLRRKLAKGRQWMKLSAATQHGVKQTVIQVIIKETEKPCQNALAQLIATIAKYELVKNSWPELFQFLDHYTSSNDMIKKEMALITLNAIAGSAGEHLKPHLKSLLTMLKKNLAFQRNIEVLENETIPFYSIKILTSLVSYVGSDEMKQIQYMIPAVLAVINYLVLHKEDLACEAMEIFDELVESEVAVIVPHIKNLLEVFIRIAKDQKLGDRVRVKAMSLISWVIRLKKKVIIKLKLVSSILSVLFSVMCEHSENDNKDEEDSDDEDEKDEDVPSSFAAQVIDIMALHLPPEKLLPPLIAEIDYSLNSCKNDPYRRKAAYLAIAVIAEGCAESIRNKYLQKFLHLIGQGITDSDQIVKNAALFALGQFSEHLQPDISKFASDLLPLLFNFLSQLSQQLQHGGKDPTSLSKIFYALESFCENLEEGLVPYLPQLMTHLLTFLTTSQSVRVRELAISAIGAAGNATKEALQPYFPQILEQLKVYLCEPQPGELLPLQVQAVDTLGVLARTIGRNHFIPMASDCMNMGLSLIDKVHDPDLRRCTYGLFASISVVLKGDMSPYLPVVMENMIDSLQSTEGIVTHFSEEDNKFPLFDELDDENDEEDIENDEDNDEENDVEGYSVENSYLEEKEDTCCALREIAANVGATFLPYLEKCFEEVQKLLEHPGENVRKAAVSALGQFCVTLHQVASVSGATDQQDALKKALAVVIPKFLSMVREDTERTVVLAVLETLEDMIKEIQGIMIEQRSTVDALISLVKDVFRSKLACQDESDNDEPSEGQDQAEYDSMLVEYAAEIIPSLGKVMNSQEFAPYFAGVLQLFLNKTKKSCSIADKSFSIGMLAEVVETLNQDAVCAFLEHLLPVFMNGMTDDDDEVRSNSVYGLGVLVERAGQPLYNRYPEFLQAMSVMLSKEDKPRARDNICGAVARLIMTNPDGVPIKEVFPVLLQCLPLQEDYDENTTVFRCIYHLFNLKNEVVFQNLHHILKIISLVIGTNNVNEETRSLLVHIVRTTQHQFPAEFDGVVANLPAEGAEILKAVILNT
ncbi:importin-4-like isoform X1 [Tachypleus tridentatus]|uniref:importin-4-like isoform X1 n=1 Tax=Tachypleus tridentatus TaxID=6853 RepID=UPI003FD08B6D